jgi:hypothetical protein
LPMIQSCSNGLRKNNFGFPREFTYFGMIYAV